MVIKLGKFIQALLLTMLTLQHAIAEVQLNAVERDVPNFELREVDGASWNQDQLVGKPYIVNFWASWCPPCVEELPALNRLWAVLESKGVGMLAINAAEGSDTVELFIQKIAIDFPVILGTSRSLTNWGGRALPTTLVINRTGQIIYEAAGPREWDDAEFIELILSL